jgi:hypothetical protein
MPKINDTLAEAGVPQAELEAVLAGNDETAWPAPFASEQRWNNNNIYEMVLIRSRHVAYLPNKQRLVVALASENQHLKPDARPSKDFFLVYTDESVKPIDTVPERKQTFEGAFDYTQFAAVSIVDPGQIIAGIDLSGISGIRDILTGAGIPESEHANVFAHSNEGGWPYLMSNFDQRIGNPDIIRQFVARRVATVEGNTLIMIVPSENTHMPEGWRPDVNIYAIFVPDGLN